MFSLILLAINLWATQGKTETCSRHQNFISNGEALLTRVIPCDYMKELLPPREGLRPLPITFSLVVYDINSIRPESMDFRVDMVIQMMWRDTRLIVGSGIDRSSSDFNDELSLPPYVSNHIWMPDPYIIKSKESDITSLTQKYASLTIFGNSTILYSARVFGVIGCQMNFYQYPVDVQNCTMYIQSFKYSSNDVVFQWRHWNAVEIVDDVELLQFTFTKPLEHFGVDIIRPENGGLGKTTRGLGVVFEFKRLIGYHLVQTFMPSFILVALSWFSFWLGLDAIPGRVTLLVTTLLTLITLFSGIQARLPPVAYVKAIDVWMAGCMFFIFAAVGEFVIIRTFREMQKHDRIHLLAFNSQKIPSGGKSSQVGVATSPTRDQEKGDGTPRNGYMNDGVDGKEPMRFQEKAHQHKIKIVHRWIDQKTGKEKILWEEIDKASRVIFPMAFFIFVVIFFPILLTRSY